jgi:ribosomal protein uL23
MAKETTPAGKQEKTAAKPAKKESAFNPWKVLKHPHLAEKSMNMVEIENKLVFIVNRSSNKQQIKEAIERGFGVKVTSVNVEITRKGTKKAYIKLPPEFMAADIASRLGMI